MYIVIVFSEEADTLFPILFICKRDEKRGVLFTAVNDADIFDIYTVA
jgi:hypothetical protein